MFLAKVHLLMSASATLECRIPVHQVCGEKGRYPAHLQQVKVRTAMTLTSPSPPPSPSATSTATPVEDNSTLTTAPAPTVYVCDRPPGRSRNPWNMCGKTFKSENDLRRHGHREHEYCYEHQVRYDVICPATDVSCRSQALAFNYSYHP